MFDAKTQKLLREEYRVMLDDVWSGHEGMTEHCMKTTDLLVKLDNRKMIAIQKPSIETHFCFGYRLSKTDTEEFDKANTMARFASRSEEYFMKENLSKLNDTINFYSDKTNELYLVNHYRSQPNDTLKAIATFRYRNHPDDMSDYTLVTDSQREVIVQAYKEERKRFTKRLNSYLKRYSMSKVKTWSYWEDE